MSEPCRERRGEGQRRGPFLAIQEKAPALICAGTSTSARSAGSFRRRRLALFWTAKNAISAILMQKGQKAENLRLFPDATTKNGGFST